MLTHWCSPGRVAALWMALLLAACNPVDYTTLAGEEGRFADWQGRWTLINYWAEWCRPCLEEIPELNELARQWQGQVAVYGVNFDGGSAADQRAQSERLGIGFAVLQDDPAAALGWPRPEVLPTTVVLDPDGQVHAILHGPQTRHQLEQVLGLSAP